MKGLSLMGGQLFIGPAKTFIGGELVPTPSQDIKSKIIILFVCIAVSTGLL